MAKEQLLRGLTSTNDCGGRDRSSSAPSLRVTILQEVVSVGNLGTTSMRTQRDQSWLSEIERKEKILFDKRVTRRGWTLAYKAVYMG